MSRRARIVGVGAFALLVATAVPAPTAAGQAAAGLARRFQISTQSAIALVHPYSTFALPDAVSAQGGLSYSEAQSAPLVIGIAGPLYVPAAGLLHFFGLPPAPPGTLPYCTSYYPGEPGHASCAGPTQETGGVNVAAANGETESRGDMSDHSKIASASTTTFGGMSSGPLRAGGGSSSSRILPEGASWTAGASMEVHDLEVAGVLTIDQIRSSVSGSLDGVPGTAAASRELIVSGAEVAGQAVEITTDGVRIADQGQETTVLETLQDQVLAQLEAAGVTVRLLPPSGPTASPDGTSVHADSGGVVIRFDAPSALPPGTGADYVFGRSVLSMAAHQSEDSPGSDVSAGLTPLGNGDTGSSTAGAPVGAPPRAPSSASSSPELTAVIGDPPEPPRPGAPIAALAAGPLRDSGDRCGFRCLYVAFSVMVVAGPVAIMTRRYWLMNRRFA